MKISGARNSNNSSDPRHAANRGICLSTNRRNRVLRISLPTAKVFTGSSNLSPSGEQKNGDNLVMIEDPRVATSYAIEALRVFDHLHFRSVMSDAFAPRKPAQGKAAKTKSAVKKSSKKAKKGKAAKKSAAPSPQTAALPGKAAAMAELTLQKPAAINGKPAWFTDYYAAGSQKERDRKLFSH